MSRRAVTLVAALGTVLMTAGPAFADSNPIGPQEGDEPGKGLSPGATILLFVVLPVLTALVVGLAVWLPAALRTNRYRPAKGWTAPPVWFAGPPEPVAAVQTAEPGDVVRGGASGNW
ncbi:MAG: hypothetical protein JWO27_2163 [Frankiales bacterium]|nr:hypothetical protein [Frankiales bacterium]MCW2707299.1 hypothetical protein [Frankiales bacterium]